MPGRAETVDKHQRVVYLKHGPKKRESVATALRPRQNVPSKHTAAERKDSPSLRPPSAASPHLGALALAAAVLLAAVAWAYLPTFSALVSTWNREPDYSHGYFVIPLSIFFLWHRREQFPGFGHGLSWIGLAVVLASGVLYVLGSYWYLEALQSWSLPLWVAGVTWFLGGGRVVLWGLPAIVFLVFMIPLPFRIEQMLTVPLQSLATRISCWLLQSLGQPAIAEGNVIVINDLQLSVVEACSGLRIFVSIIALAFVVAVLTTRPWWMKASLFLMVVPVTLVANAVRIAATGLLRVYVSDEAANHFGHDLAGWLMILFAAGLLGAWIWYLGRLVVEVETMSTRELLEGGAGAKAGVSA